MRCPFCGHLEDKVVDSRTGRTGDVIRRRRECMGCERRFTTYEQVEDILPIVVKKDGRREPYERSKIVTGLQKACQKRPVSQERIEEIVHEIENELFGLGEKEVPSTWVGQKIMEELRRLDDVAYVRFASVYRQFKDISEFMDELKVLLVNRGREERGEAPTAALKQGRGQKAGPAEDPDHGDP
jgi:transcriptional repressor NrdR